MATINPLYAPSHSDVVGRMSDITPDDSTDLAEVTRGLRVNVSGNVKLMPAAQDTPVTVYMLAGVDYPYMVNRVYSTGTTATGIVGLY